MMTISNHKQEALARELQRLNIAESDLEENFIRGSGAGGQKINKTSIVVQLTHRPTGLQVRCQEGRSQAANRFFARRLLAQKIQEKMFQEKSVRQKEIEKIRRQKRKRSRRAKEKMLAEKKHQSVKKNLRGRPLISME